MITLTLKIALIFLLCLATPSPPSAPAARPCDSDADCASSGDVCRNGYCVARRNAGATDAAVYASDCNPGHKDPPAPNDPSPPKDAKPPGGYNPKV